MAMTEEMHRVGHDAYLRSLGYFDLPKDEDGFCVLKPTADHVDRTISTLTTDISDLESKLKEYRAQKVKAQQYTKTEEYKESKKKSKAKKEKKNRDKLLSMMFNAVMEDEDEEDEENYRDSRRTKAEKRKEEKGEGGRRGGKPNATTLETQYGKRYAPIVSMFYDNMADFDRISKEIDAELKSSKGQTRNMYRGQQVSNMLSAMNNRASMVKEISRIADKLTDYEYKLTKDKRDAEGGDVSKSIAMVGARYLSGVFEDPDNYMDDGKKKGGKKGKKDSKEKAEGNFTRQKRAMGVPVEEDDDDEDEEVKAKKKAKRKEADSDEDLAKELAKALGGRKGEYKFTDWEKNMDIEKSFTVMVAADPLNPKDWEYVAVDPKTHKRLKGETRDRAKSLLPKKRDANMTLDFTKGQARDRASGRHYPIMLKE